MKTQDGNQWNAPENKPKGKGSEAKLPGEEKNDIRSGAQQQDQLDKLKPEKEEDRAPNEIGSPPAKHIDKGE